MITHLSTNSKLILVLMVKTNKSWEDVRSQLVLIDEAIEIVGIADRAEEYASDM